MVPANLQYSPHTPGVVTRGVVVVVVVDVVVVVVVVVVGGEVDRSQPLVDVVAVVVVGFASYKPKLTHLMTINN